LVVTALNAHREVPELGYRASAAEVVAAGEARLRLLGRASGLAVAGTAVALVVSGPAVWVGVAGIAAALLTMVAWIAQGDRRRLALDRMAELGEPPVDPAPALRPLVERRQASLVSQAHRHALAAAVQRLASAACARRPAGSPAAVRLAREPELADQVAAALETRADVRLVVAVERLLSSPDGNAVEPVRRLVA
jgi:hypothetical protein